MMETTAKRPAQPKGDPKTLRASVSFPCELYATLEGIAKEKKVSLAWIVRDAAEQYVANRWPILSGALDQRSSAVK